MTYLGRVLGQGQVCPVGVKVQAVEQYLVLLKSEFLQFFTCKFKHFQSAFPSSPLAFYLDPRESVLTYRYQALKYSSLFSIMIHATFLGKLNIIKIMTSTEC